MITRGFVDDLIITRGLGKSLAIIVDDNLTYTVGAAQVLKKWKAKYPKQLTKDEEELLKGLIKTEQIVVRKYTTPVEVQVIKIRSEDLESIKIAAQLLGFEDIKVYMKDEVKII